MADPVTLETERLILRPPVKGDLPRMFGHINTPGVLRHLAGMPGLPVQWSPTSDPNVAPTRMLPPLGLAARPELGYADPDYPPDGNPTTISTMDAARWPLAKP